MLERIRDVQLALVDLSFCLNEIHVDLLRRTLDEFPNEDFTADQGPMHRLVELELCFLLWDLLKLAHSIHALGPYSLKLGDDVITSMGTDTVVGDVSTFYVQIDSTADGFEFVELGKKDVDSKVLTNIMNARESELDDHVEIDHLIPSAPLTNSEQSNLAYWDVPFHISVGNDIIDLRKIWFMSFKLGFYLTTTLTL